MEKLTNGIYNVKITSVNFGESEHKKTRYMLCRFEAGNRYYDHRIYLTGNSIKFIKLLYYKASVKSKDYSGTDLIGAELGIEITSGSFVRETGEYVTFPNLGILYSCVEMREMEMARSEDYEEAGSYSEDKYDPHNAYDESRYDDSASIADVFDANISEIARDMGKEPWEITDGDIMEYNGY